MGRPSQALHRTNPPRDVRSGPGAYWGIVPALRFLRAFSRSSGSIFTGFLGLAAGLVVGGVASVFGSPKGRPRAREGGKRLGRDWRQRSGSAGVPHGGAGAALSAGPRGRTHHARFRPGHRERDRELTLGGGLRFGDEPHARDEPRGGQRLLLD